MAVALGFSVEVPGSSSAPGLALDVLSFALRSWAFVPTSGVVGFGADAHGSPTLSWAFVPSIRRLWALCLAHIAYVWALCKKCANIPKV